MLHLGQYMSNEDLSFKSFHQEFFTFVSLISFYEYEGVVTDLLLVWHFNC